MTNTNPELEWFQIDDAYGNIYSSYYAYPNGEHMSSHYNVYIEQHLQAIANDYCPFGGNDEAFLIYDKCF